MDVTDLSLLEWLYLIGLIVLFLSAFIYAVYPLFCNCDNSSLDELFIFPEEACVACEHGQSAMHCAACFQCMPDLPCGTEERGERDQIVVSAAAAATSNPETQSSQSEQARLRKRNSMVQEDSNDTTTTTTNILNNSVLDEDV